MSLDFNFSEVELLKIIKKSKRWKKELKVLIEKSDSVEAILSKIETEEGGYLLLSKRNICENMEFLREYLVFCEVFGLKDLENKIKKQLVDSGLALAKIEIRKNPFHIYFDLKTTIKDAKEFGFEKELKIALNMLFKAKVDDELKFQKDNSLNLDEMGRSLIEEFSFEFNIPVNHLKVLVKQTAADIISSIHPDSSLFITKSVFYGKELIRYCDYFGLTVEKRNVQKQVLIQGLYPKETESNYNMDFLVIAKYANEWGFKKETETAIINYFESVLDSKNLFNEYTHFFEKFNVPNISSEVGLSEEKIKEIIRPLSEKTLKEFLSISLEGYNFSYYSRHFNFLLRYCEYFELDTFKVQIQDSFNHVKSEEAGERVVENLIKSRKTFAFIDYNIESDIKYVSKTVGLEDWKECRDILKPIISEFIQNELLDLDWSRDSILVSNIQFCDYFGFFEYRKIFKKKYIQILINSNRYNSALTMAKENNLLDEIKLINYLIQYNQKHFS